MTIWLSNVEACGDVEKHSSDEMIEIEDWLSGSNIEMGKHN